MEPEVFGDLKPPGKTFIRVAPKSERARVQPKDVGWATEGDQVHVHALSCDLKKLKHEEQVFAAIVA